MQLFCKKHLTNSARYDILEISTRGARKRVAKKPPFLAVLVYSLSSCVLCTLCRSNRFCLFTPLSPTYKAVGVVHICYTHKGATMRESCLHRLGLTYSTCEFRSSRLPYLNSEIIITPQEDDVKHFFKNFFGCPTPHRGRA